jgi:hypothetical protein
VREPLIRLRFTTTHDHGGLRVAISEFDGTTAVDSPAPSEKVSVGRQVLRRKLNDRLYARANGSTQELELFCECGRATCRANTQDGLLIAPQVYEQLRRIPTRFLIKHRHTAPAERIIDSHQDFLIVERVEASEAPTPR